MDPIKPTNKMTTSTIIANIATINTYGKKHTITKKAIAATITQKQNVAKLLSIHPKILNISITPAICKITTKITAINAAHGIILLIKSLILSEIILIFLIKFLILLPLLTGIAHLLRALPVSYCAVHCP